MEPCDDSPRIVDLIASFGSGKLPAVRAKAKRTSASNDTTKSPISPNERRLTTHGLRPTIARAGVLSVLEKARPSCLDASRMYRILSDRFDGLTLGSVYRALNDLWIAGLLVRTEGARGRAFYALKPEVLNARHDALRCRCGARMVFVEDPALREHLQLLATANGFTLDAESVFTIATTCAQCRQPDDEAWEAMKGVRRSRTRSA